MSEKRQLIQTLHQVVGNKIYLRDLEKALEKLDLTPAEKQSLIYLSRDLQQLSNQASSNNRKTWGF